MTESIKQRVEAEMRLAMKARAKPRLAALRLMLAALKQVEIDERVTLDEPRALAILDKMTKQRNDSLTQYRAAGRDDLADTEALEIAVIAEFMPPGLDPAAIEQLVVSAISESGAASMNEMGKVMALLIPQVQGRADMAQVASLVKARLAGQQAPDTRT